jgi:hypothetical protein
LSALRRAAAIVALAAIGAPGLAVAAEPAAGDEGDAATLAQFRRLDYQPGGTAQLSAALFFGRGLRFNNPYRLRTELGSDAESMSLTASYLDAAIAMGFGPADGLHHGAVVHMSFALEGVAQQAISASYVLGYRGAEPFWVYGRLGPSLLVAPDPNLGGEVALGAAYYVTGVFGVTGELVGNLFYGAGTYTATYTACPILSGQLGIIADLEVLP